MAHPARFRDDDPILARVRKIALAFPGSAERISHGRPNFFTRKTFVHFGATVKGDHDSRQWEHAIQVLPEPQERRALLEDDRFFAPGYTGPSGWVGIDLAPASTDWDEVVELIDMSYRATASQKLIAELDARSQ
ncbi:MAG: MmcQ/YjbR family DNA-binding protein [Nakamurella sp.]